MTEWELLRFDECLDRWIDVEDSLDDLRLIVTAWVLSRFDDPYQGVIREPHFPNLWFGRVPGSTDGGHVVTCAYWIFERLRQVRCDSIATLSLPL